MKIDRNDVLGFLGLVSLVAGFWWIYRPAALIVLGLVLLSIAWILARPKPKE